MKNELALNGEPIKEKIYPNIFKNVGMIRGEYIIREINKNITCNETKIKLIKYLNNICSIYHDEEVWYRFSELTNTESNNLYGTSIKLEDRHPLFGTRGIRRSLLFKDEFNSEINAINLVYENHKNLAIFLPFVNDASQLKIAIEIIRSSGYKGKIGCMLEIPSAFFDLENIINLGINKLVVGMNDLTSFIFATVRNSELHNMKSPIMMNIIKKAKEMCDNKKIDFAIAGYLSKDFIDELNQLNICSIIHYSYIPDIFNKSIKYPNHLENIKNFSKK